jgi:hypothetical protein
MRVNDYVHAGRPMVSRFMDTVGDGTGTNNFIGNHAATTALVKPSAGKVFYVQRLVVSIQDGVGMRAEHYGTLGAALTNGIQLHVGKRSPARVDYRLTDPALPVKENAVWGSYCYDVDRKDWGAGDELMLVRWTFAKAAEGGVVLRKNDELILTLNDNFTGLTMHRFLVQGFEE